MCSRKTLIHSLYTHFNDIFDFIEILKKTIYEFNEHYLANYKSDFLGVSCVFDLQISKKSSITLMQLHKLA